MANVVITGGSRGIGAEAVRQFAARGDRVYFLYEKQHEKAKTIVAETGASAFCCDVADRESVEFAFAHIRDVDILICNAGICHTGLLTQTSELQWNRLFDVNVKGMYHCIKAAMPHFLKKQSGCIITVSSMWGQVGASCEVAYSATKGAVIAMSKALAQELGPAGVRVNCIAPGVIETDMCANIDPEIMEQLKEETPVGRNGTVSDVAHAMLYLADAEFVTGQVLAVNGGFIV